MYKYLNRKQFLEETHAFFDGALNDALDDDASDETWFQMGVDTCNMLLKDACIECKVKCRTGIDGHDIFMYWIEHHPDTVRVR